MNATSTSPYLLVNATQHRVPLPKAGQVLTIGRDEACDLVLHADSEAGISRLHCQILPGNEFGWQLVDKSTNGTVLRTQDWDEVDLYDLPEQPTGRSVVLVAGDELQIPARPTLLYTLTVVDPNRTRDHIDPKKRRPELKYRVNLTRQVLYCQFRGQEWEHPGSEELRAQARQLLMTMAEYNVNAGAEVACPRRVLIDAVWGDLASERTDQDLNKLVAEVRELLGPDLIKTQRGVGFLLQAQGVRK
jgi:hypothetical protein